MFGKKKAIPWSHASKLFEVPRQKEAVRAYNRSTTAA
jgi:hypothetical protein